MKQLQQILFDHKVGLINTEEAEQQVLNLFAVINNEVAACEFEQKKYHLDDGKCAKCNDYKHNHKAS